MLYEKKKEKSKKYIVMVCVEVSLLLILISELFYFYVDFPVGFWSMKAVDIANVTAQVATAGAFYLGFHQYHRNKRVERQAVLVAECKTLIVKMIAVIKELKVGLDTDFENIKYCSIKLGSLGSDFQEFFVELDENVNKGVVRMHWQNMYLSEFVYAMQKLEMGPAIGRCNIRQDHYLIALNNAHVKVSDAGVMDVFERYSIILEVLGDIRMSDVREKFNFSDFYLLVTFFFEGRYVGDYMYGSLSRLDIRARAPLIAAIKDACKFDM
ncbi:hypothetical protein [Pseudomonas yamanorum]|uniref:hypothetical protein n=1 Tax=Pseudomonas yamanorum TaxID=515393 RepID=UPI002ED18B03|nr:hypothetical protein VYI69_05270 [Pseudomonas yamanorum]